MKKTSVLIVEDEPLIADDIESVLLNYGYEVVGIADEASDALKLIEECTPNIALLDVNIQGDIDGIELAKSIAKYKIPFIYLTSYYDDKTLNRAKQTNPSGYIVKPFDEADLKVNIEMALAKQSNLAIKKQPQLDPERFFIRQDGEILSLHVSDILFVESYDNYAYVQTKDKKHLISHTLKSIYEKIQSKGFVRIHKSYVINFNNLNSVSEGYAYVEQHQLPIGKSFRQELFDLFNML